MPGNLHAFNGYARLAPEQPRKDGICIGYTQRESVRDFQTGSVQAGYARENVEHGLESEIFSTEQITLAGLALFGDEQVAGGALFNADKVQAGFDIAGHCPIQKIEDDFSSR